LRKVTPWSVILCKFQNEAAEPHSNTWYQQWFNSPGLDNLYDYWNAVSYGAVTISATVRGWYQMSVTLSASSTKTRYQRAMDCINTATAAGYTVPTGNYVATMVNAAVDAGFAGYVYLDPGAQFNSFAGHEMAHHFGLSHSYTNDLSYQNADWSAPGEYGDEHDLMSVLNAYMYNSATYGLTGPGLMAYWRDKLGWIWISRIFTFGANSAQDSTITLADLNTPSTSGYLMARVPFDPSDLFHYYTIEYHQKKTGPDAAIPKNTVLIHEITSDGKPSVIEIPDGAEYTAGRSFQANGVTIDVLSISGSSASVRIRGNIAQRCLQGFVWREAFVGDYVCVTPATRSQAWFDNALAASRVNPNGGAYGPDTCLQGYVWREARPTDHVCVTLSVRTLTAADNAAAATRVNPARFVYGPNTCKSGYVWREADNRDYVCVTPTTRSQAWSDNALAASRVNPNGGIYGPDTCLQGYVWREAFPGDHVCVIPTVRTQTRNDNDNAVNLVLKP
jgi:hypothetical protein